MVMAMDESVTVELSRVRTVKRMPITESCIAKKEDLENWPHLRDIELQQLDIKSVMLIVGLKDNPSLFLPLECRVGGKGEPVAIRYSLGMDGDRSCWWRKLYCRTLSQLPTYGRQLCCVRRWFRF